VPLYEFVIRTSLASHDLNTAEGRVAALRAAAPVVAGIRDKALRPEYARQLAGWLGMEPDAVLAAVSDAGKRSGGGAASAQSPRPGAPAEERHAPAYERPDRRDPVVKAEALSLGVLLQAATEIQRDQDALGIVAELTPTAYSVPQYRAVFEAITAAGGPAAAAKDWVSRVAEEAGETLAGTVNELAVTPLPHDRPDTMGRYARSVLAKVLEVSVTREIAELRGRMQRAGEGTLEAQAAFESIVALEARRRALREE
jgi:DNA primase